MTVTVDVTPKVPSDTKEDISNNLVGTKKCPGQDLESPTKLNIERGRCSSVSILSGASSSQSSTSGSCAAACQLAQNEDAFGGNTAVDHARTSTHGRQKREDKTYKSRGFGNGGKNERHKSSKGLRDGDNSSSNGGNSGADGNGEDNDGSDDDDEEYMEDDDDDDDDEDDEEDEEDESKNADDEEEELACSNTKAEKSRNGVDIGKKENDNTRQRTCKEKAKQGENPTSDVKNELGVMNLGFSVPAAELLDKLPNSPSDVEHSLAPASPGTPISLHGIICHETMGGVLVLNIKWRNKIYSGSLIDCSRHAWATPRFQTEDDPRCDDKIGSQKGGKGKRLRSTSMTSSGSQNKEDTPLKHKLRGRKKGVKGAGGMKGPCHKMLGKKRKTRNADEESDDNTHHGKRSCTLKTSTSPQPSPTLIPCPEQGCDKKYKHINGLRYHQAHAHLEPKSPPEEANQSDDRSTSTSPSPGEEFKEPSTKASGKSRTSRMSLRSQSVSPTSGISSSLPVLSQEKKSDAEPSLLSIPKASKDAFMGLSKTKKPKAPGRNQDGIVNQENVASHTGPCGVSTNIANYTKGSGGVENRDHFKQDSSCLATDLSSNLQSNTSEMESKEVEEAVLAIPTGADTQCMMDVSAVAITQVGKASSLADTAQGSQEVWETVIDSGCSRQVNRGGLGFQDHATLKHGTAGKDNIHISIEKDDKEGSTVARFENRLGVKLSQSTNPKDTTSAMGLSELGYEFEDISENEEEIDPGQDTDYRRKLGTHTETEPKKQTDLQHLKDVENKCEVWSLSNVPARFSNNTQGATQMCETESKDRTEGDENDSSGNDEKAFLSSSRLDWLQRPGNVLKSKETEVHGKVDSKTCVRASHNQESNPSLSREGVEKIKQHPVKSQELDDGKLKDDTGKRNISTYKGISMESLKAKSLSRSAVEPPLTNTDTPCNRYKVFQCRTYGDGRYDMSADDLLRSNRDPLMALAPIRNPELVKEGRTVKVENFSPGQRSDQEVKVKREPNGSEPRASKAEHDCQKTGGTSSSTMLGPQQKRIKQDKQDPAFSESKHPINSSTVSPLSVRHSHGEQSSNVDRSANPCYPAMERALPSINITSSETMGIKIEKSKERTLDDHKSAAGEHDSSKLQDGAVLKASFVDDQMQKPSVFSRAHSALMQKHVRTVAPTLPVGVAHPYSRVTDRRAALQKPQDRALTTTTTVISSLPYAGPSGRIQAIASSLDTDVQDPELALKSKAQEIPVGEVSPVALKRSPGPAMHAGLPSVVPMLIPAIKGSVVRGVKSTNYSSEQTKQESRQDSGSKHPDTINSSASSSAPAQSLSKGREISMVHQKPTASPSKSPDVEVSLEDSDVVIVKEDMCTVEHKDKGKAEKEGVLERGREMLSSESYKSHPENRSSEECRKRQHQLQQQFHLQQLYQAQFVPGGMPLDMAQLACLQGIAFDPVMAVASPAPFLSPEGLQSMHYMQQQRHVMNMKQEQEPQRSNKLDKRSRAVDRLEAPSRSSEDKGDQEKDVLCRSKMADQEKPLHSYESGDECRAQKPSKSSSHQSHSKTQTKSSSDEPQDKRSRTEQTKNDQLYEQRQKHSRRPDKLMQRKRLEQKMEMLSKLEHEHKQPGGSPSKRKPKDMEETEETRCVAGSWDLKGTGIQRDVDPHMKQESSSKSVSKPSQLSVEPDKSHSDSLGVMSSKDSPHKLLSASHSPWTAPTHSPNPPRLYEASSDGHVHMSPHFLPTNFQAYLQSQHLQPGHGQFFDITSPQAAMLMTQHMPGLPPGLMMRMPTASSSEASSMALTASASRDRNITSPHQRAEPSREYATLTRPHSHGDVDTQLSFETLVRLKEDASERPSSAAGLTQDRSSPKGQHTSGRQSGRENMSRSTIATADSSWRESLAQSRPSIISSNLALARRGEVGVHGHSRSSPQMDEENKHPRSDVRAEEEMLRRQRIMAEHGGNAHLQAMHMGHGHMRYAQFDPAYGLMTPSQHAAMDHYFAKRQ